MSTIDGRLEMLEQRLDAFDRRLRALETWAKREQGYHLTIPANPPTRTELPTPRPSPTVPSAARREQPRTILERTPPVGTGPAPTPLVTPRAPARRWSAAELERLLTGRFLAWGGGLAILFGIVFFLARAFREGWIGPTTRVGIGIGTGLLLFTAGAWLFERREALLGHVLVATGLGTLGLSFVAGTRLYELIRVDVGLACSLALAASSALIAVRSRSQVVAAYGLITALAAPIVLGPSPALSTVAFVATALTGCTGVSLWRTWSWLPPLAFLLSAPQLWSWVERGPSRGLALLVLTGYWCLNAVAAGGEEFRHPRTVLRPTSATLLLGNAAFLVAVGFGVLDSSAAQGLFLLCVATAHFLLGAYFLRTAGQEHAFGLLALGTGLAALTMAVPVSFGGPVVPIAWAAEAAALAWVFSRRQDRYTAVSASLLGLLAVSHFVTIEYPFYGVLSNQLESPRPFLNAGGGTLAFLLAAVGFAVSVVRSRGVRSLLAWLGLGLLLYALPFEISGLWLLTGYSGTAVLGVLTDRTSRPVRRLRRVAGRGLALTTWPAALAAAALAAGHALTVDLPLWAIGSTPTRPFADSYTIAAGILGSAGLLSSVLAGTARLRRVSILAAALAVAWLMPIELASWGVVVAWSVVAAVLCVLGSRDRGGADSYGGVAALLGGMGAMLTIGDVAPLDRLLVDPYEQITHPLLWSGATAALLSLAAILSLAAWLSRRHLWSRRFALGAGVFLVYALSVGVVDEFQRHVGASSDIEGLRKQAQVALSILWAALGGGAFVVGIVTRMGLLRASGLALLGAATTKVFLYDLAALDATYRVPSFIGLGLLLLASSYAYQRLRPAQDESSDWSSETLTRSR